MNIKKVVLNLVLLTVAIIFGVLLCTSKDVARNREINKMLDVPVIYNNVFIDNTAVGGLTKEQALEKLKKESWDNYYGKKNYEIRTANMSYSIKITAEELGYTRNYEKAVEDAYKYGRGSSPSENRATVAELENAGHFITTEYNYDEENVKKVIGSYEEEINEALDGEKADMENLSSSILEMMEIDKFDISFVIPIKQA